LHDSTTDLLWLRLHRITYEAQGIHAFELRLPSGAGLPPFSPGAHIDLHLGNGMVRSYSLCNCAEERHRYLVCVNRDRAGRGGSAFVHDALRVGDVLPVAAPRNNFALDESAAHTLLIAGGIGITPLWCMVQRLETLGRPWTLHYCARSQAHAALLAPIRALAQRSAVGQLHLHFDDAMPGRFLDLPALVAGASEDTHLYCCGPLPMLEAFENATAALPGERVHVEYFSAKAPPDTTGGFQVQLAGSGRVLGVPAGCTILDVLLEAGVEVPYSCREGVCGTCETRVLAGVPDHRDLVLTAQEMQANQVMMVCCSGSRTPLLVLDL